VKTFREIACLPEFERDLKRLLKRFRTLKEDFEIFIRAELLLYHKLGKDNKGIVQIPDVGISTPKIYKARKFACRSLRGRGAHSGIRVIYAYFEKEDKIELIEIFFKGDKENEDRERILRYYRK
jgi:mRNA-degrading endonuclease RelE of RelBE toxin-antitoxin system